MAWPLDCLFPRAVTVSLLLLHSSAWQSCRFFVLFCYVIVVLEKNTTKSPRSPSFQRCHVRMNWPGRHVYRLCEELCLCVACWWHWYGLPEWTAVTRLIRCPAGRAEPLADLPLNAIQLQLSVANFSHSLNSLGLLTNRKVNFHTEEKISALGNNRVNRMLPSDLMLIPWSGTKPSWLLH